MADFQNMVVSWYDRSEVPVQSASLWTNQARDASIPLAQLVLEARNSQDQSTDMGKQSCGHLEICKEEEIWKLWNLGL